MEKIEKQFILEWPVAIKGSKDKFDEKLLDFVFERIKERLHEPKYSTQISNLVYEAYKETVQSMEDTAAIYKIS